MHKFPATPTRAWKKGDGVAFSFLLRRLAAGESVLLTGRHTRHASAAISLHRKANAASPGKWTSRTVAEGVEILRLPDDYDGSLIERRPVAEAAEPDIFS